MACELTRTMAAPGFVAAGCIPADLRVDGYSGPRTSGTSYIGYLMYWLGGIGMAALIVLALLQGMTS